MALRMIRQPSDTPNVSNIDDIVPFRYAYGDQNGYVLGKGGELELDVYGNVLTLQTGRIVLNGVESDIEQNGVEITLDVVNETRYCVLYYRVNLGTNTTQILLEYSTAGYPDVLSRNDDLTKIPTGSANLELYRFEVNNGVVSNKQKMIKEIEYGGKALVGYDISKGTVEERLTRLGFKQGTLILGSAFDKNTVAKNEIKKVGNFVYIEFMAGLGVSGEYDYSIKIPDEFLPENEVVAGVYTVSGITTSPTFQAFSKVGNVEIDKNGYVSEDISFSVSDTISSRKFVVGYEIKTI